MLQMVWSFRSRVILVLPSLDLPFPFRSNQALTSVSLSNCSHLGLLW